MPDRQSAAPAAPPSHQELAASVGTTAWTSAVVVGWILAVVLVGIGGDFPLSDDWSYAHVVRALGRGEGFDLLPWTGASLLAQALYGAAACLVTGFSYETLRASTLLLALVGVVSFSGLLRELGAGARASAAGAAVLAFSPLWFHLSFTFMTDVPFAALALLSAWLYVRGLRSPSRRGLVLASIATAACFLVRQHALSIGVAAAAAALWPGRTFATEGCAEDAGGSTGTGLDGRVASRLLDAAAALALPLAVAAAWAWWATSSGEAPLAVQNKLNEAASTSLPEVADAAFRAMGTLGFLLLPWAVTLNPSGILERRVFVGLLAAFTAIAGFLFVRDGSLMFYLTNTLGLASVGAVTTRDVLFLALPDRSGGGSLPPRVLLTAVSLASAAMVTARLLVAAPRLLNRQDSATGTGPAVFCLLALVLSGLGTLIQSHYYFDRYLVLIVPLAVASLVAVSPAPRLGAGFAAAMLLMSAYSVAGTHDYLEWNRARWDLLATLEGLGVSPRSIDGGVEYNAERLAVQLGNAPTDAEARSGQPAAVKSWWWVVDDEWVVAFGPLDGYAEADSRTFRRWLPPSEGKVLALHRSTTPSTRR